MLSSFMRVMRTVGAAALCLAAASTAEADTWPRRNITPRWHSLHSLRFVIVEKSERETFGYLLIILLSRLLALPIQCFAHSTLGIHSSTPGIRP